MDFASLISKLSGGAGMGKSSSGVPMVDDVTKTLAEARESLANKLGAQTAVGRYMRAFNSSSNPISGVINAVGSLFAGSKYRSDQYRAGEKYMLYVLGINIHSYKKVEDPVVPEALQFFSTLLGINIESWTGIEELRDNIPLFKKNRKPGESDEKIQAAQQILKSLPFNDVAGAWVNPIIEIVGKSSDTGSIIEDVKGVAAGLGLNKNILLYAAGGLLLFILFFRRK